MFRLWSLTRKISTVTVKNGLFSFYLPIGKNFPGGSMPWTSPPEGITCGQDPIAYPPLFGLIAQV